jgi:hypothetical protein
VPGSASDARAGGQVRSPEAGRTRRANSCSDDRYGLDETRPLTTVPRRCPPTRYSLIAVNCGFLCRLRRSRPWGRHRDPRRGLRETSQRSAQTVPSRGNVLSSDRSVGVGPIDFSRMLRLCKLTVSRILRKPASRPSKHSAAHLCCSSSGARQSAASFGNITLPLCHFRAASDARAARFQGIAGGAALPCRPAVPAVGRATRSRGPKRHAGVCRVTRYS